MILGVYLRNSPRGPWLLKSHTQSAEIAKQDKISSLAKAKKEGKAEAEVAVKVFDVAWLMPETLEKIEEDDRLLYN